jgi:hypothetical protein
MLVGLLTLTTAAFGALLVVKRPSVARSTVQVARRDQQKRR